MGSIELVVGGAGAGKTARIVSAALEASEAGEPCLVVGFGRAATHRIADRLDAVVGDTRLRPSVCTVRELALDLLRSNAVEAGADPFLEPLTLPDRLAMLLDRIEDLPLRRHEVRGDPVGVLTALIRRIDGLKAAGMDAGSVEAAAADIEKASSGAENVATAAREREFAELMGAHDRLLRASGTMDHGQVALEALRFLRSDAARRKPVLGSLLVDGIELASVVERDLVLALAAERPSSTITLDPMFAGGLEEILSHAADVELTRLGPGERPVPRTSFWACSDEHAQAQAVAGEVERLVAGGEEASRVAVCVRSTARDARAVAAAIGERSIAARISGPAGFFGRAEIRDVIAWLRLLADPHDAAAVSRALVRPPVELRPAELARCTAIARRRKLDMVSALDAALESPQLAPEGRDRVAAFLKLQRAAAGAFEEMAPDLFVQRLINRVGLRRGQLFSAHPDAVERLVNLSRLCAVAAAWLRRHPGGSSRRFARWVALAADLPLSAEDGSGEERLAEGDSVLIGEPADLRGGDFSHVFVVGLAGDERERIYETGSLASDTLFLSRVEQADDGSRIDTSPAYEAALAAAGGQEESHRQILFSPGEELHSTFRMLRDESLEQAWRAAGSLGELRLDTHLDVDRSVARHLEMLKLAALLQRPEGQSLEDALRSADEAIGRVATPEQRRLLELSALDEFVLEAERGEQRRRHALALRREPSLDAFIPRRGGGLALSAGDVDLYRTCPLKYKFGRVFAIPQEPTINQRFGIVVHQVLERFHTAEGTPGLPGLLSLFDASWRRGGFGTTDEELQFRDRAVSALTRFHEREAGSASSTVMVEKQFTLPIGPHLVRGRVDRVDRLPDGAYEVIDYKTGRHKSRAELADDVQLALYRLAAQATWAIDPDLQSYWYVIDDEKVTLRAEPGDGERVERAVLETAQGIESQDFEPRPSYAVCSWCDYRTICPAAET